MLVEFQVAAEKLRQVLLAQVRAREFCFPDKFPLLGGTYVLDRLELSSQSTIGSVTGTTRISVPGMPGPTVTAIQGRLVEYVQPMTVFATELGTLDANGRNASTNAFQEDRLRFELTMQVTAGVPQLRFRLASVDASLTSALIMSKASIDVTMDMDLSSIQAMLGGAPVTATNAGLTIDATGARLVMRIELNGVTDTLAEWRTFFRTAPADLLGTNDWSLLIDKDLIIPLALARVTEGLAGTSGFAVVSGPSASWVTTAPEVYVTLEGDALKACSCFGADVNVRTLVVISVGLSVPPGTTDVLRLRTWMGFVPDSAPIFCCALTAALFWHFLGAAMLAQGKIGWLEFLAGVGLGPIGVFIGANVIAFNQKPGVTPGGSCSKISDTEFECDQPLQISTGLDFSFTLRSIAANPGGPLLEGTMRTFPPAAIPMLVVDRVEEFDWRLEGSCHADFQAACRAYIHLRGARTICKVEILDDPSRCYTAAVEKNPLDPSWLMPHITLTPDVDKLVALPMAYPCRVLLWTDGGARLITLTAPKPKTTQEETALDDAAQKAKIRCLTDSAPFWETGRRFNRKWLVDPPPETYYEQVWQVLVTGLTEVEQVVAEDVAGNVVATAVPSLVGMAHLSALFVSEAGAASEEAEGDTAVSSDELALVLQSVSDRQMMSFRAEASQSAPRGRQQHEGEHDTSRQLVIKQVLLVRASRFQLGGRVRHLAAARMRNVPVLVSVTDAGVRVFDVSHGERPRTVQTVAGSGIRGATIWNDRLLVWGDHGMAVLPVRESRIGVPAPWLPAPVLDATTVGGQLAVLTTEGVSLHSADLSCAAQLPAGGASSLLAAGPRLLVVRPTEIEVFDLSGGSPRREAEHALPAGSLYAAPPTNDSRSVVFSQDGSGGGRMLALAEGKIVELTRYARAPWFHRTARVGDLVARPGLDGSAITVFRIANTYEA
jgi:hypothetical protein